MTEYNIRLNPNCATAVHTGLKFKAGDKGITFKITVDELDTAGTTAKIVFLRANGTSVEKDITEADGVFNYKTLGNEFAIPGKTVADVKFYAADDRVSTASFVFDVCGDTMDGLGAGTGGYSDRLEQLVEEAEAAGQQAVSAAETAGANAITKAENAGKLAISEATNAGNQAIAIANEAGEKAKADAAEAGEQAVSIANAAKEQAQSEINAAKAELEATETSMVNAREELEQLSEELESTESDMLAMEAEMSEVLQNFKNQYGEVGALNPRGDWNSSTKYQIRDVVYHGGFSWTALVENTGVTPSEANKTTWAKHMDMDGIEQKISNIQTTSKATLSQAGWYRVAEYKAEGSNTALGGNANSCTLEVKRTYSSDNNEVHILSLASVRGNQSIVSNFSKSNKQLVTKARYTHETATHKAYLEIYYSGTAENHLLFEVTHGQDYRSVWQAITPTLTEETVDGVTVTTTYDIPANASPVTDLDIADKTYLKTVSSATSTEDPNTTSLPRIRVKHANCPTSDSTYIIDTIFTDGEKEIHEKYQIAQGTGGNAYLGFRAKAYNSTWTNWEEVATTADLANYLPLDGNATKKGRLDNNGNVNIYSSDAVARNLVIYNSLKSIGLAVATDGTFRFRDNTNSKDIISSTADGTNTFNGTATGNLPLNGGGTVKTDTGRGIKIQRKSNAQYVYAGIDYGSLAEEYGSLGFDRPNMPIMVDTSGTAKKLLHEGNSAKVSISATAPSDTSALWVDSSNKKVKAYIDGAWTVIA